MKRIKFLFAWYDLWIGVFVDTKKKNIYIFPLPMLGIVINYGDWKDNGLTKSEVIELIKLHNDILKKP